MVLGVRDAVDLERTLFIVSSKSGGTVETISHYRYFSSLCRPEQFVVITDPGSPLQRIASDDGLRHCFLNTPEIGGRYSVLSLFGLVPAVLMGVGIEALLHRCQVAEQNCAHYDSSESNSGLWLGAVLGELARQGRDKLTFFVSPPIESFGLWVEQLMAESTGKHGRGILPVADEPLGPPRVLRLRPRVHPPAQPRQANQEVDEAMGRSPARVTPTLTLTTHGAADLGRIFFLSEFAVAVAGWALEINPFDQPNVQEAKDNTARVLDSGSIPLGAGGCRRCAAFSAGGRRAALVRGHPGLSALVGRAGLRRRRTSRGDPRRHRRGDHVRLRPEVSAFHRAAAQGRAAERSLPAADRPMRARRRHTRRGLFVQQVDRGSGGR